MSSADNMTAVGRLSFYFPCRLCRFLATGGRWELKQTPSYDESALESRSLPELGNRGLARANHQDLPPTFGYSKPPRQTGPPSSAALGFSDFAGNTADFAGGDNINPAAAANLWDNPPSFTSPRILP